MNLQFFAALALLLSISASADAQRVKRKGTTPLQLNKTGNEVAARYSIEQLNGRWQEISRMTVANKEKQAFSDTLLMKFDHDKVALKDATSMRMTMNGVAEVDPPNILQVAGDSYTIRSLDSTTLVVDDGEFIKEFRKKDQFYYETVGHIIVQRDSFAAPVKIDISILKGKWLVYRKQAAPGVIKSSDAIIKSLEISAVAADGSATGQVVFYTADVVQSSSCKIIQSGGSLQINAGKYSWTLNSYKASGDEFVFGDVNMLLYYAKKL